MKITGTHPYAGKYPLLSGGDLDELVASIMANGLGQPIVITPDGMVLDGRNRARACEMAGVTPTTVVYEGADLAEFVIDANTNRRNQSTGARAMSTALVLAADGRRENGRWKRGTVGSNGSVSSAAWQQRLNEAGVVLDHAPDLADAVAAGELALDAAYKQAIENRDAERNKLDEAKRLAAIEADAKTFITENAPDLARQVGKGKTFRTYAEALAIWEQRNREAAAKKRAEEAAAAAKEREEIANAEQRVESVTRALFSLHSFAYPEARQRFIDNDWPRGAKGASPAMREYMTADRMREVHDALGSFIKEWEQTND